MPSVVDAFCPSCAGRLNEPPAPVGTATAGGRSPKGGERLGLLMMLGGVLALFPTVMSLARGNWPDAVWTGGVGVLLIIGGLIWAGKKSGAGQAPSDSTSHT